MKHDLHDVQTSALILLYKKNITSFDVNLYLHDKWHEAPHPLIY